VTIAYLRSYSFAHHVLFYQYLLRPHESSNIITPQMAIKDS